ncbi:MAG: SpoIID/LytB domain-containing protein [Solirubrobacteraceae bacterium]
MRTNLLATLLVAVLTLAFAAGPAQGASRVIVRGAGFGHGVGMSQYGAYGFANQGKDHAFILGHYYSGTRLAKLGGATDVRVLLRNAARITFRGATRVAGGRALDPARAYAATRALGGGVVLRSAGGRDLGTYAAPLRITGSPAGVLLRGRAQNDRTDGRYRGDLELRPAALGVSAINVAGLEDYVRGVVAGEVPASWPAAALRAQAVAARTYAVATRKDGDGFDQYADTRSQVYIGVAGEQPSTNAAVGATRDEIVAYQGKPIVTYYFSTSGGRTENVENSFIGAEPQPWLKSVDDPHDDGSPRHRWTKRMSVASADARLGGLVKGDLRQIKVLRRGRSPRVVRAQIVGTGGRTSVTGPQLRARLGLYDTWARFTVITANGVRGDGNVPRAPKPKVSSPGGSAPSSGGAAPSARAAAVARAAVAREVAQARVAGAIAGRVAPAAAGRTIVVQRRVAGAWVAQLQTRTRDGGRYRATVFEPGLYRVSYAGEVGPAVRVG